VLGAKPPHLRGTASTIRRPMNVACPASRRAAQGSSPELYSAGPTRIAGRCEVSGQRGTTAAPWSAASRSRVAWHDHIWSCWMRIGLEPAPLPADISDRAGPGAARPLRNPAASLTRPHAVIASTLRCRYSSKE
jgi:hypothetical protein